jgi:hypothetical protein
MLRCVYLPWFADKRIACLPVTLALLWACACGAPGVSTQVTLTSLTLTPHVSVITLGQSLQFVATGSFSDGTHKDMTLSAEWMVSRPEVVSLTSPGGVTASALGDGVVIARVGNVAGTASLTVGKVALVSIAVTPSVSQISLGGSVQLSAVGTFSDKSTQDVTGSMTWSSLNPDIAAVNSAGVVTSKTLGKSSIQATTGSLQASTEVDVTAAPLVSIQVSSVLAMIPVGTTTQFSATGIFKDGTTLDISNAVTWNCVAAVASISNAGQVTGKSVGTTTVTASSGAIQGAGTLTVSAASLVSLSVTGVGSALPVGSTQQLLATGMFTDGTTRDVTESSQWTTSSADVVTVNATGMVEAESVGSVTVSASVGQAQGGVTVTVSSPELVSVEISPANPVVPLGSGYSLSAIGKFTDGQSLTLTDSLNWTTSSQEIATISEQGIATGLQVGSTEVTVSVNGLSGSTTLVVQPLEAVGYFTNPATAVDTSVRIVNPGTTGQQLCAMVYVFDADQQMAECCGCAVSMDSLLTLSLRKDLLSNPLTGVVPSSGSLVVVTSDYSSNVTCDASTLTPAGAAASWSTHLQVLPSNRLAVTEDAFSPGPLGDVQAANLQAQCSFIEQLGSSQGICSCGAKK